MKQVKDAVHYWKSQRFSALVLLFLFPWCIYLIFCINNSNLLIESTWKPLINPLEFLFFIVILFYAFHHAVLGMQIICEDYIHNPIIRFFLIRVIQCLSIITYVILTFTIFCSNRYFCF
ncbi:succinate dehydrogenase, hydrophobic membrane anchor protein [Wolbachia pipientis]|uniref:Succinate dehydrogenase hydrophobic membrane anchor subunit n=1 Tax=Wolbachia pipientis TaxID=955 RepID=A0A1E7QJK5_WOLPI|nr:succinate dehydrogenase, hydrophobic membrane anchor protein [Wolbachia pipientis]OEY86650.1 succinate dehydrogenase, hydrophobic membrane anchor protein [Wolbachia pipientis]